MQVLFTENLVIVLNAKLMPYNGFQGRMNCFRLKKKGPLCICLIKDILCQIAG